jgi:hypothetical protein
MVAALKTSLTARKFDVRTGFRVCAAVTADDSWELGGSNHQSAWMRATREADDHKGALDA